MCLLPCHVLTGVVKSITATLFLSVSTYESLTLGADIRTSQYNETNDRSYESNTANLRTTNPLGNQ